MEKNIIKVLATIQSADFEEGTLTVKMPDGFWDKHKVRAGSCYIVTEDILKLESTNG